MNETTHEQPPTEDRRRNSPPADSSGLLQRAAASVGVGVAILGGALLVWYVFDVLLLIFAGVLLSTFLHGCSIRLSWATRLPYGVSLAGVIGVLLVVLVASFVQAVPQIVEQVNLLFDELAQAAQQLYQRLQKHDWVQGMVQDTLALGELIRRTPDPVAFVNQASSTTFGAIISVLVIAFVGIYGAVEPAAYHKGALRLVPPAHRSEADALIGELGETLWWWLIGRVVSMTLIGVCTVAGLWWLNIPMAFLLGFLAALLTFIPNIGPVIAVTPPALLALEQSGWTALAVVGFYTGLQAVESYIFTPLIQRKAVALPPVLLLTAQLVLAAVGGFLGLAVATPIMAVTIVLIRRLYVERLERAARPEAPSSDDSVEQAPADG